MTNDGVVISRSLYHRVCYVLQSIISFSAAKTLSLLRSGPDVGFFVTGIRYRMFVWLTRKHMAVFRTIDSYETLLLSVRAVSMVTAAPLVSQISLLSVPQ